MDILIAFLFGSTLLGCYVLWQAWQDAEERADLCDKALDKALSRIYQLEHALWSELPEPEFATGADLGLDDDEF